jgi:hypothetical protein
MRPLQSIAMGLVIVALHATFGGFDALPDPLGWLLVLLGVRALPAELESKRTLLGLAALAGAVSIPLWIPAVSDALYDTDPSLLWAVNLPQLGFGGLLAHVLARRAADAEDTRAAAWLRVEVTGFVVVTLLPILVWGAGVDALAASAYVAASLVLLALIWMLFSWSSRPWAGADRPTGAIAPE